MYSLKKGAVVGVVVLCCCLLFSGTSHAWRFRGGTVEDIINGIKQTLETAKQSEIAQSYATLKKYETEYNSVLKNLNEFSDEIKNLTHAKIVDNDLDGILSAQKDADKQVQSMTNIDYSTAGGLTLRTLEINQKRFDKLQDQEILNTQERATQLEDFELQIQNQVAQILSDRSEGVISEQQKILLLRNLLVQLKNATAITGNQAVINDSAIIIRIRAETRINEAMQMKHSATPPNDAHPLHQENLKKYQLDRLPR